MKIFNSFIFLFVSIFLFSCNFEPAVKPEEEFRVKERISAIEIRLDSIEGRIEQISNKLDSEMVNKEELQTVVGQEIEQINTLLNSILKNTNSKTIKRRSQAKENLSTIETKDVDTQYKLARKLHQEHKLADALDAYKGIIGNKMKWYDERARFFYGAVLYDMKSYRKSILKLERFLGKYKKSKFAPTAILLQAKALVKMKKKSNAKIVIKELISKYPSTKQAKEAKTLLRSL